MDNVQIKLDDAIPVKDVMLSPGDSEGGIDV